LIVFFPQVRFPLVLARTVMGYLQRQEEFPDYLILVDDDTYYNMDLFSKEIMEGRDSSTPLVTAGCLVNFYNLKRKKAYDTIPYGGFGLTLSKGSLERFTRPILQEPHVNDTWAANVLRQLDRNLIFERQSFEYGMSLIELMYAFTRLEKLSEIEKWTRGFCFHGDWVPALFVTMYDIGGNGPFVDAIQNSTSSDKGNCKNNGDACNATTSLACHYQTPDHLKALAAEQQRLRM
jgi:hypothetical protein